MTISVVQSKTDFTTTPSFSSATTAGNCLVICVCSWLFGSSLTGITIGGSADNFAQAVTVNNTTPYTWIWYDRNCVGGQTALSISGTMAVDSGNGGVFIYEVAGLDTSSSVLDQTGTGTGTGTAYTASSPTTTVANEIWFGCIEEQNALSTQPGSPWVNLAASFAGAGYNIVSSTGTCTYAGTATSGAWAESVATFKGASGGGGGAIYVPKIISQNSGLF